MMTSVRSIGDFAGHRIRLHQILAERFSHKYARRDVPVPMVSITFDDFPRSALTIAGKMLTDYGWRGTYYAAMRFMDTDTIAGPMFTRGDLEDLLTFGHELGCHTFGHISCLSIPADKFAGICAQNRAAMATMLNGYELRNFSFPFGHLTLGAKQRLRSSYDTCRSIQRGINLDPVDLGLLRANPVYSRLPIETVKQLIRNNSKEKGWLVLYTHDVSANPTPYGCTPEYFAEILSCVHESGADVVTIREASSRLQLSRTTSLAS